VPSFANTLPIFPGAKRWPNRKNVCANPGEPMSSAPRKKLPPNDECGEPEDEGFLCAAERSAPAFR
jgi:hypothetical protein